ncbi:hypothetical protein GCM10009122_47680 [Fulvivirga kasyanovii]|uniref:Tetratricopeptide repeat protein n=1 Tax=Fulvivirga kasyanovii TaxID=396812 RepID=A0ABW9RMW5_9BACT|nr:tetratricopeptide repeat protein [Fulvivirga kasyanovii]MTI25046.1 tetratricopeptide repeat protein [Fulvivirga kasyanovii]
MDFYLKRLLLSVSTLAIFCSGYAQKDIVTDTLKAGQFYIIGDSLYDAGKFTAAAEHFKDASKIFHANKCWERFVDANGKLSSLYEKLGEYELAIEVANASLAVAREKLGEGFTGLASTYDLLANVYRVKGNYDLTLDYYHKSLNIRKRAYPEEHFQVANSYYYIGITYTRDGAYDSSEYYLKKALAIREKIYKEPDPHLAHSYNSLGGLYFYKGYYENSLGFFKKALSVEKSIRGEDHPNIGIYYDNIGTVYSFIGGRHQSLEYKKKALSIFKNTYGKKSHFVCSVLSKIGADYVELKEYDKAMQCYREGLVIAEKIMNGKNTYTASINNNIAMLYDEVGKGDSALIFYQRSISTKIMLYGQNNINVAESYGNIAENYSRKNDFSSAYYYYRKALNIYADVVGEKHPVVANIYNNLGNDYSRRGLIDSSFYAFKNAISANSLTSGLSKGTRSRTIDFLDPSIYLSSLYGIANVNKEKFYKYRQIDHLRASLINFQQCDTLIDEMHKVLLRVHDKLELTQKANEVYVGAMKVSLILYKETNDAHYAEMALYFSEKGKARILSQHLAGNSLKDIGLVPYQLLSQEDMVKMDRSFYESQLQDLRMSETFDTVKVVELENKVFELNRQQDSLITIFKNSYPKYYQLQYRTNTATSLDVKQSLPKHNTLVEYSIGNDSILISIIGKDTFAIVDIARPEKLESEVKALQNAIKNNRFNDYTQYAYSIYKQIFKPVEKYIKEDRVIIVPDGILWHLNFDLLLTSAPKFEDYRKLDYLIKKYTFSYAHSATTLSSSLANKFANNTLKECLAFSFTGDKTSKDAKYYSFSALRDADVDLPGSREEIRAIADIVNGDYYVGDFASKHEFKNKAKEYLILHLALHGEVDDNHPMNSKLFFTPSDSSKDGTLYAYELYNMSLNAEMAVLSACNTGAGQLIKGEGIMSLGRAFAYAGCKSLVVSQWEVPDVTTPGIMKNFYKNLKDGLGKDEALRKAKLDYLEAADNFTVAPYYWGSFVVIGENSPIELGASWTFWEIAGTLVVMAVIVLLVIFLAKRYGLRT